MESATNDDIVHTGRRQKTVRLIIIDDLSRQIKRLQYGCHFRGRKVVGKVNKLPHQPAKLLTSSQ